MKIFTQHIYNKSTHITARLWNKRCTAPTARARAKSGTTFKIYVYVLEKGDKKVSGQSNTLSSDIFAIRTCSVNNVC